MSRNLSGMDRFFQIAKKNAICFEIQTLKHGYRRAVIPCSSWNEQNMIRELFKTEKGLFVESHAIYEGEYEGYVYVIDSKSKLDLDSILKKEYDVVEDWWQRYHAADTKTKQLMACGRLP